MTYSGNNGNITEFSGPDDDDLAFVDIPDDVDYNFIPEDLDSYRNEVNYHVRTIPLGPPKTRDNESHNPGRQIWGPKNSQNSYGKREGRNFLLVATGEQFTKRSEWQSGPSDNSKSTDYSVTNCGYWTTAAGKNCYYANKSGRPDLMAAFQIFNRKEGNFLFDVAHAQDNHNEGESAEYGMCGLSGYFLPDYDEAAKDMGEDESGGEESYKSSVGIERAYCMYRSDATIEEWEAAYEAMEDMEEFMKLLTEAYGSVQPESPSLSDILDEIDKLSEGEGETEGASVSYADSTKPKTIEEAKRFFEGYAGWLPENVLGTDLMSMFRDGNRLERLRNIKFKDNFGGHLALKLFGEIARGSLPNMGKSILKRPRNDRYNIDRLFTLLKEKGELSALDCYDDVIAAGTPETIRERYGRNITLTDLCSDDVDIDLEEAGFVFWAGSIGGSLQYDATLDELVATVEIDGEDVQVSLTEYLEYEENLEFYRRTGKNIQIIQKPEDFIKRLPAIEYYDGDEEASDEEIIAFFATASLYFDGVIKLDQSEGEYFIEPNNEFVTSPYTLSDYKDGDQGFMNWIHRNNGVLNFNGDTITGYIGDVAYESDGFYDLKKDGLYDGEGNLLTITEEELRTGEAFGSAYAADVTCYDVGIFWAPRDNFTYIPDFNKYGPLGRGNTQVCDGRLYIDALDANQNGEVRNFRWMAGRRVNAELWYSTQDIVTSSNRIEDTFFVGQDLRIGVNDEADYQQIIQSLSQHVVDNTAFDESNATIVGNEQRLYVTEVIYRPTTGNNPIFDGQNLQNEDPIIRVNQPLNYQYYNEKYSTKNDDNYITWKPLYVKGFAGLQYTGRPVYEIIRPTMSNNKKKVELKNCNPFKVSVIVSDTLDDFYGESVQFKRVVEPNTNWKYKGSLEPGEQRAVMFDNSTRYIRFVSNELPPVYDPNNPGTNVTKMPIEVLPFGYGGDFKGIDGRSKTVKNNNGVELYKYDTPLYVQMGWEPGVIGEPNNARTVKITGREDTLTDPPVDDFPTECEGSTQYTAFPGTRASDPYEVLHHRSSVDQSKSWYGTEKKPDSETGRDINGYLEFIKITASKIKEERTKGQTRRYVNTSLPYTPVNGNIAPARYPVMLDFTDEYSKDFRQRPWEYKQGTAKMINHSIGPIYPDQAAEIDIPKLFPEYSNNTGGMTQDPVYLLVRPIVPVDIEKNDPKGVKEWCLKKETITPQQAEEYPGNGNERFTGNPDQLLDFGVYWASSSTKAPLLTRYTKPYNSLEFTVGECYDFENLGVKQSQYNNAAYVKDDVVFDMRVWFSDKLEPTQSELRDANQDDTYVFINTTGQSNIIKATGKYAFITTWPRAQGSTLGANQNDFEIDISTYNAWPKKGLPVEFKITQVQCPVEEEPPFVGKGLTLIDTPIGQERKYTIGVYWEDKFTEGAPSRFNCDFDYYGSNHQGFKVKQGSCYVLENKQAPVIGDNSEYLKSNTSFPLRVYFGDNDGFIETVDAIDQANEVDGQASKLLYPDADGRLVIEATGGSMFFGAPYNEMNATDFKDQMKSDEDGQASKAVNLQDEWPKDGMSYEIMVREVACPTPGDDIYKVYHSTPGQPINFTGKYTPPETPNEFLTNTCVRIKNLGLSAEQNPLFVNTLATPTIKVWFSSNSDPTTQQLSDDYGVYAEDERGITTIKYNESMELQVTAKYMYFAAESDINWTQFDISRADQWPAEGMNIELQIETIDCNPQLPLPPADDTLSGLSYWGNTYNNNVPNWDRYNGPLNRIQLEPNTNYTIEYAESNQYKCRTFLYKSGANPKVNPQDYAGDHIVLDPAEKGNPKPFKTTANYTDLYLGTIDADLPEEQWSENGHPVIVSVVRIDEFTHPKNEPEAPNNTPETDVYKLDQVSGVAYYGDDDALNHKPTWNKYTYPIKKVRLIGGYDYKIKSLTSDYDLQLFQTSEDTNVPGSLEKVGGTLRFNQETEITAKDDNFYVYIGTSNTNRTEESWSRDGEPAFLEFKVRVPYKPPAGDNEEFDNQCQLNGGTPTRGYIIDDSVQGGISNINTRTYLSETHNWTDDKDVNHGLRYIAFEEGDVKPGDTIQFENLQSNPGSILIDITNETAEVKREFPTGNNYGQTGMQIVASSPVLRSGNKWEYVVPADFSNDKPIIVYCSVDGSYNNGEAKPVDGYGICLKTSVIEGEPEDNTPYYRAYYIRRVGDTPPLTDTPIKHYEVQNGECYEITNNHFPMDGVGSSDILKRQTSAHIKVMFVKTTGEGAGSDVSVDYGIYNDTFSGIIAPGQTRKVKAPLGYPYMILAAVGDTINGNDFFTSPTQENWPKFGLPIDVKINKIACTPPANINTSCTQEKILATTCREVDKPLYSMYHWGGVQAGDTNAANWKPLVHYKIGYPDDLYDESFSSKQEFILKSDRINEYDVIFDFFEREPENTNILESRYVQYITSDINGNVHPKLVPLFSSEVVKPGQTVNVNLRDKAKLYDVMVRVVDYGIDDITKIGNPTGFQQPGILFCGNIDVVGGIDRDLEDPIDCSGKGLDSQVTFSRSLDSTTLHTDPKHGFLQDNTLVVTYIDQNQFVSQSKIANRHIGITNNSVKGNDYMFTFIQFSSNAKAREPWKYSDANTIIYGTKKLIKAGEEFLFPVNDLLPMFTEGAGHIYFYPQLLVDQAYDPGESPRKEIKDCFDSRFMTPVGNETNVVPPTPLTDVPPTDDDLTDPIDCSGQGVTSNVSWTLKVGDNYLKNNPDRGYGTENTFNPIELNSNELKNAATANKYIRISNNTKKSRTYTYEIAEYRSADSASVPWEKKEGQVKFVYTRLVPPNQTVSFSIQGLIDKQVYSNTTQKTLFIYPSYVENKTADSAPRKEDNDCTEVTFFNPDAPGENKNDEDTNVGGNEGAPEPPSNDDCPDGGAMTSVKIATTDTYNEFIKDDKYGYGLPPIWASQSYFTIDQKYEIDERNAQLPFDQQLQPKFLKVTNTSKKNKSYYIDFVNYRNIKRAEKPWDRNIPGVITEDNVPVYRTKTQIAPGQSVKLSHETIRNTIGWLNNDLYVGLVTLDPSHNFGTAPRIAVQDCLLLEVVEGNFNADPGTPLDGTSFFKLDEDEPTNPEPDTEKPPTTPENLKTQCQGSVTTAYYTTTSGRHNYDHAWYTNSEEGKANGIACIPVYDDNNYNVREEQGNYTLRAPHNTHVEWIEAWFINTTGYRNKTSNKIDADKVNRLPFAQAMQVMVNTTGSNTTTVPLDSIKAGNYDAILFSYYIKPEDGKPAYTVTETRQLGAEVCIEKTFIPDENQDPPPNYKTPEERDQELIDRSNISGDTVGTAYFDSTTSTSKPGFDNSHFTGSGGTINTITTVDGEPLKEGEEYSFTLKSISERNNYSGEYDHMYDDPDVFEKVRVWWRKGGGPWTLSRDESSLPSDRRSVLTPNVTKTLTCEGSEMSFGAVSHDGTVSVEEWPKTGTPVQLDITPPNESIVDEDGEGSTIIIPPKEDTPVTYRTESMISQGSGNNTLPPVAPPNTPLTRFDTVPGKRYKVTNRSLPLDATTEKFLPNGRPKSAPPMYFWKSNSKDAQTSTLSKDFVDAGVQVGNSLEGDESFTFTADRSFLYTSYSETELRSNPDISFDDIGDPGDPQRTSTPIPSEVEVTVTTEPPPSPEGDLPPRDYLIKTVGGNSTSATDKPNWATYTDIYTFHWQSDKYELLNNNPYSIRMFWTNDATGKTGHHHGGVLLPGRKTVIGRHPGGYNYVVFGAYNVARHNFQAAAWTDTGKETIIDIKESNGEVGVQALYWQSDLTKAPESKDFDISPVKAIYPNVTNLVGQRIKIENNTQDTGSFVVNVWFAANGVGNLDYMDTTDKKNTTLPSLHETIDAILPNMTFGTHVAELRKEDWPQEGYPERIKVVHVGPTPADPEEPDANLVARCQADGGNLIFSYMSGNSQKPPTYRGAQDFIDNGDPEGIKLYPRRKLNEGITVTNTSANDNRIVTIWHVKVPDQVYAQFMQDGHNGFATPQQAEEWFANTTWQQNSVRLLPGTTEGVSAATLGNHNMVMIAHDKKQGEDYSYKHKRLCVKTELYVDPPNCENKGYWAERTLNLDNEPEWTSNKWEKPLHYVSTVNKNKYKMTVLATNSCDMRLFFSDDPKSVQGQVTNMTKGPRLTRPTGGQQNNSIEFEAQGKYMFIGCYNTGKTINEVHEKGICVEYVLENIGGSSGNKKAYWSPVTNNRYIQTPNWEKYYEPIWTEEIEPDSIYRFKNKSQYDLVPWISEKNNFVNTATTNNCFKMSATSPSFAVVDKTNDDKAKYFPRNKEVYFWVPAGNFTRMRFSVDGSKPGDLDEKTWLPDGKSIDYELEKVELDMYYFWGSNKQSKQNECVNFKRDSMAVRHQYCEKGKNYKIRNCTSYTIRLWWTDNRRGIKSEKIGTVANLEYKHTAGDIVLPETSIDITAPMEYFVPIAIGDGTKNFISPPNANNIGIKTLALTHRQEPGKLPDQFRAYPMIAENVLPNWKDFNTPILRKTVDPSKYYKFTNSGYHDVQLYSNSDGNAKGTFKKIGKVRRGASLIFELEKKQKYVYFCDMFMTFNSGGECASVPIEGNGEYDRVSEEWPVTGFIERGYLRVTAEPPSKPGDDGKPGGTTGSSGWPSAGSSGHHGKPDLPNMNGKPHWNADNPLKWFQDGYFYKIAKNLFKSIFGAVSAEAILIAGAIIAGVIYCARKAQKFADRIEAFRKVDILAELVNYEAENEILIGGVGDVQYEEQVDEETGDTMMLPVHYPRPLAEYCGHKKLDEMYLNMTISPTDLIITRMMRCRMNGYLFHLNIIPMDYKIGEDFSLRRGAAWSAAKKATDTDKIRIMRYHSLAPTYSFGLFEMENDNFKKILRRYETKKKQVVGMDIDRYLTLDTRRDHIKMQNFYRQEDQWFKPVTSRAPFTADQTGFHSVGGKWIPVGDLGFKSKPTGPQGPGIGGYVRGKDIGLYMENIFNDKGTGTYYREHYNTHNSMHSWGWEIAAGESRPWPGLYDRDGETVVGINFELMSHYVDKGNMHQDWQIVEIIGNFEERTYDDEGKITEIKKHYSRFYPVKTIRQERYVFRNVYTPGTNSTVDSQRLGDDAQLPNPNDSTEITCTSTGRQTLGQEAAIKNNWIFTGLTCSAWIGEEAGMARSHTYSIKNLKPLIKVGEETFQNPVSEYKLYHLDVGEGPYSASDEGGYWYYFRINGARFPTLKLNRGNIVCFLHNTEYSRKFPFVIYTDKECTNEYEDHMVWADRTTLKLDNTTPKRLYYKTTRETINMWFNGEEIEMPLDSFVVGTIEVYGRLPNVQTNILGYSLEEFDTDEMPDETEVQTINVTASSVISDNSGPQIDGDDTTTDTGSDDATGDTGSDDTTTDTGSGDTGSDDTTGDTGSGDTGSGDTGSGDTGSGYGSGYYY